MQQPFPILLAGRRQYWCVRFVNRDMRTFPRLLVLCFLCATCAFAIPAIAHAAPGLDQYVESLPNPEGNKPGDPEGSSDGGDSSGGEPTTASSTTSTDTSTGTDSGSSGDGSGSNSTVSDSNIRKLESRGSDGAAAAGALSAVPSERSDATELLASATPEVETTPIAGVLSALTGGSGSLALPLILLTVLIGGLVLAARRSGGPNQP